ncbi:multicopper oxidase domain-containing protein [Actinacidiphila glaucinigra]|uniref:multicopper oxidase family protein n=1 Tax=Actinacidiphila glaucinigra TaxID=235986 RepID=UPI00324E7155
MAAHKRRTFFGIAGGAVAGVAGYGGMNLLAGGGAEAKAAVDTSARLSGGKALDIEGPSSPRVTELTPFEDELPIPPTLKPSSRDTTEVRLVEKKIRLHSQLPATRMWTYEGYFPGPTIEARRGQRFRLAWRNELTGTSPVKGVFVEPEGPPPGFLSLNTPGSRGAKERPEVAALTAWTSVHLHGGRQHAISDGAPDSGVTRGSAQLAEYTNDTAAAHLFYHDHAMPVTALNVMAGLLGNYIIRDENEDRLDLPRGRYEIPLTIADVNFDTDGKGRINGQLLAKRIQVGPSIPGVMAAAVQFQGPYTMVNGRVWPYLDVEATAYRFRVVNASNARAYILALVDEETGQPVKGAIKVIGTDMGLLDKPQGVEASITLTPAERVDIVIDFAAFRGRRLRLVNVAPGAPGAPPAPAGTPVPAAGVPYPQVMQFRVGRGRKQSYVAPKKLDPRFKHLTPSDIPQDAVERFVMLSFDTLGMPTIMELQEAPAGMGTGKGVVQLALPGGTRTFRVVGKHFEDATNFFAAAGSWEKWTFISVGPVQQQIQHPMHIHLMNFQLLERRMVDGTAFDTALGGTTRPITIKDAMPIAVSESGWKDTVNMPANSMVTVAGQFGRETGRFMYHCHILDHEDEGMMRPFVVMPPEVLTLQNMMLKMMNTPGKPAAGGGAVPPMDHGAMDHGAMG